MTLESILSEGPMTAQELSRRLQRPIEDVYERLVSLEANGIAVLTYIKGSQKGTLHGLHSPKYQWTMA
jgi:DNA-binding transcriptional regulator GbsR (MarR family)